MSTTYEDVYNKFTPLIEDIKLLSLDDQDVLDMMKEWLIGAIGDYIKCPYDLSQRDDDAETFSIDIPEFDQKILARYMVTEWVRPQLNSTLLTRQFFGGNEEKFFAQSNQIEKLQALLTDNEIRVQKLIRDKGYMKNFINTTST
jgi:hypothetical protein